jgi:UDP-N-acetylglucosamine 2-epimerase (non-hydrolysing)
MAPVARAFQRRGDRFEHLLATTGQHRDMAAQMLEAFGLVADVDLELGEPDQTLASFASRALAATAELFATVRPDVVLVQGDTTTVMAASLAAFYAGVRVGHVEAGLRTGVRRNPFPEELNRRVTSVVADWHFAPTERAAANLRGEGIDPASIHVTGNTVVDALAMLDLDGAEPDIVRSLPDAQRLLLVTAHRRESFGAPMRAVCRALRAIAAERADVAIVYPVHPNPSVGDVVHAELDGVERVHLVAPMSYRELLATMRRSAIVLTDSGGIQEEAPSFGVPVLVLRDASERRELIDAGGAVLVGTDERLIVETALRLLDDETELAALRPTANPFGDGRAAERIVEILERDLVALRHAS